MKVIYSTKGEGIYHKEDGCNKIENENIEEISSFEAEATGLDPCKLCFNEGYE